MLSNRFVYFYDFDFAKKHKQEGYCSGLFNYGRKYCETGNETLDKSK